MKQLIAGMLTGRSCSRRLIMEYVESHHVGTSCSGPMLGTWMTEELASLNNPVSFPFFINAAKSSFLFSDKHKMRMTTRAHLIGSCSMPACSSVPSPSRLTGQAVLL